MATATKSKQYSAEEKKAWKEQKIAEQREQLESALVELTSSEGWSNFIKFGRSNLSKYSLHNALMIWSQKRDASLVRGRKQWEKEGITVDQSARPIAIFAPMFVNVKDSNGNTVYDSNGKPQKKVGFYKTVRVFDVSETNAPTSDIKPMVELGGDDYFELHPALEQFARELGYSVEYREDTGAAHGWVDERMAKIVMNKNLSGNALVRTLVHELCHVYGEVNYTDYTRDEAEVLVESATVMALSIMNYDVSAASVPYIASWGGDLKVLDKNLKLVDELVKTLTEKMGF